MTTWLTLWAAGSLARLGMAFYVLGFASLIATGVVADCCDDKRIWKIVPVSGAICFLLASLLPSFADYDNLKVLLKVAK